MNGKSRVATFAFYQHGLYQVRTPTEPVWAYRGSSLIGRRSPLGPYNTTMPRALWCCWGVGVFIPLLCVRGRMNEKSHVERSVF
jgi:hypothetical protein